MVPNLRQSIRCGNCSAPGSPASSAPGPDSGSDNTDVSSGGVWPQVLDAPQVESQSGLEIHVPYGRTGEGSCYSHWEYHWKVRYHPSREPHQAVGRVTNASTASCSPKRAITARLFDGRLPPKYTPGRPGVNYEFLFAPIKASEHGAASEVYVRATRLHGERAPALSFCKRVIRDRHS